ncbi:hypothetical protein ACFL2R_00305 [Patescibacteria group bacterium]
MKKSSKGKELYRPCPHPECQQTGVLICDYCDTKGLVPKNPCPKCKGKGILCGSLKEEFVSWGVIIETCPDCSGTGVANLSNQLTTLFKYSKRFRRLYFNQCPKCEGKKIITCPTCLGEKRIINDNPCSECEGKGSIARPIPNMSIGVNISFCPKCEGSCVEKTGREGSDEKKAMS